MTDEIRDPDDRKAPKQRIVYLEARIQDMYDAMLKAGKAKFEGFHLGQTKFRELRPFYVKDATRETCMCIYHLRWAEFSSGLLHYRHQLRKEKVSSCSCNFNGLNEKGLRKQLVCEREEGSSHDREACVTNRCVECKDAKRLTSGPGSLCSDELRDPGGEGQALQVHYEKYMKQTYYTKDGTAKDKKEFVKVSSAACINPSTGYPLVSDYKFTRRNRRWVKPPLFLRNRFLLVGTLRGVVRASKGLLRLACS